uniref:Uncharacterized protein n=1 Tax=Ananas comosus var. bracteatus TaxID=296719 RepID=A0A6V7Q9Y2_ANACO|nr:unnamed protein product [Ananas comosus var. bracteatus]
MLEGENVMLKENNAKLEAQLSSASTAAAPKAEPKLVLIHLKVAKALRLKKAANRELMLARLEEASDTATETIAEVLMEIKAEHGHSDCHAPRPTANLNRVAAPTTDRRTDRGFPYSAKQAVEIDEVPVPDQEPGSLLSVVASEEIIRLHLGCQSDKLHTLSLRGDKLTGREAAAIRNALATRPDREREG